jgi:tetratricopeptide (TPR) repeat protein
MNKLKLIAFYQWIAGIWNEWLDRIDYRGVLRNPVHREVETAAGRRIRVLIAPFGSDPQSLFYRLLLRRSIKRSFGHAVAIIPSSEPLDWRGDGPFELVVQQRARAQQTLEDNHCDVLVVRQPAPGRTPLLRLVTAESKRQLTYSQIEKFDLPVFFNRRSHQLFTARLFLAASQVVHMGDDLRIPLLNKLVAQLEPVPPASPRVRGLTLVNHAFLYGLPRDQAGSSDDLRKAAQTYHEALKEFTRERDPLGWAAVQDDLGGVLRLLGEKERDASTLQQAVTAFSEALSERTRERAPMQWASTQSNLGLALASLGTQKQTIRLEEAVTAFQAALTEWTRERVPLDWARVQNDLGRVLMRLSDQSKDTAPMEQAIAAFREALEERRHERVRTQWAVTQHNLGSALLRLGERSKSTVELHEAVTAFRAALQERNRHVFPQQWSTTQNSLGSALAAIGVREADRAYLQQAVAAYREVLKVRTRKRSPVEWSSTQHDLGTALLRLAELENDPLILKEAIAAFESAHQERTRERKPLLWALTQINRGAALMRLAESETGTACLENAVNAYRGVVETYEKASMIHAAKAVQANLSAAETRLKAAAEG